MGGRWVATVPTGALSSRIEERDVDPGVFGVPLPPAQAFLWPEPAEDLWVFTTTEEPAEQLKALGYNVKFAGNMAMARARGVSMAIEYNKVFGLGETQAGMVASFLR